MYRFRGLIFAGLVFLAGCATTPTQSAALPQGYTGQVVAVRNVQAGALTMRITNILGQRDDVPLTAGREIVVRLADGEVKSFVPPQGAAPEGLAPGDEITITETPDMRISLR